MSEPHRALLGTINAGHDAINAAEHDLQTKAQLPKLGNDAVSSLACAQNHQFTVKLHFRPPSNGRKQLWTPTSRASALRLRQ